MQKNLKAFLSILLILGLSGCNNISQLNSPEINTAEASWFKFPSKTPGFESLTRKQADVVYKYAPIVFHETKKGSRPENWDFITSFDFDGDLIGNNNEQSIVSNKFQVPATLYYALVETSTHYFITYSSFHPLDWSKVPSYIPYTWHENDMESLQVVVRKGSLLRKEKALLLSTQAHIDTAVYASIDSDIFSGDKKLEKESFRILTEDLYDEGTHPAIYMEDGGHGIHSLTSKEKQFAKLYPPQLKEGFTFIPSKENKPEYYQKGKNKYSYQLLPVYDTLWSYYRNNINIGDGKLLDGFFDYRDELVDYKNIPRHFDSDRLSGPNKYDSGIAPFAFSFSLNSKDLGVIFFNPAKKYAESLKIQEKWSRDYTYNPYVKNEFISVVPDSNLIN